MLAAAAWIVLACISAFLTYCFISWEYSRSTEKEPFTFSSDVATLAAEDVKEIRKKSEYWSKGVNNPSGYLLPHVVAQSSNKSLSTYNIKAASNCAFTGKYIAPEMVAFVLQRGCRILDFQLFVDPKLDQVVVGILDDTQSITTSYNTVPLVTILNEGVLSTAFSSQVSNSTDPLFLYLRIYPGTSSTIYSKLAMILTEAFTNLHVDKYGRAVAVTGATSMASLMSRVVIIVDKSADAGYKSKSLCPANSGGAGGACMNFGDLVNLESGGGDLAWTSFSGATANPKTTSSMIWAFPDDVTVANVSTHWPGITTVAAAFWKQDDVLAAYEAIFSKQNVACISNPK